MSIKTAVNQPGKSNKPSLIPEEFIAQVNEKADLLAIIGRSVKLKKSGANNWIGLCPFHTEKGPSFAVTPAKAMYHCFGCGATGGAISFLMEHDGVPFREAVKDLAISSGLPLPPGLSEDGDKTGPVVETGPLFQAMDLASQYFRHVLNHDQASRAYMRKRGITPASAKKFMLGAAPDEWRGLQEAFPDYETNEHIVLSGLIREKESEATGKKNRYDTFRGRIMFPLRDTRGRTVAFVGRALGDGEPKYMNSPESPIFNKSGSLYGLFEAREAIRQKKVAIVVEGNIDVVMLSQNGVENVVACMGTSMTRWHVERLLTQCDMLVFAFDGDAAGRKAARRALETCAPLMEDQHDIRFLILPDGKDPDDIAREEGAAAFDERVRTAASFSEFLIGEIRLAHNNLASAEDRARFASEASAIAGRLGYKTKLRRLLLQRISDESMMPGSVIKKLQNDSRSRAGEMNLWTKLSAAAIKAPSVALAQRELLLELLDTDDGREMSFAQTLQGLSESQGGELVESSTDASWMIARDIMNSAVDLIGEHRNHQLRLELKEQWQRGEITQSEYMRSTLEIESP